jgi:sec-independent protein translocase protein TatB
VFGVSFPELFVLGSVALLVLGPDKLPGMLRTLGQWLAKLRRLTTEVRHQSGIDDVLRAEGFDGGLNELRSIMRGGAGTAAYARRNPPARHPPAAEHFVADRSREYPVEGPDAYGALAEDLLPAPVNPAALTAADDVALVSASSLPLAPPEGTPPRVAGTSPSATPYDVPPKPAARETDG